MRQTIAFQVMVTPSIACGGTIARNHILTPACFVASCTPGQMSHCFPVMEQFLPPLLGQYVVSCCSMCAILFCTRPFPTFQVTFTGFRPNQQERRKAALARPLSLSHSHTSCPRLNSRVPPGSASDHMVCCVDIQNVDNTVNEDDPHVAQHNPLSGPIRRNSHNSSYSW